MTTLSRLRFAAVALSMALPAACSATGVPAVRERGLPEPTARIALNSTATIPAPQATPTQQATVAPTPQAVQPVQNAKHAGDAARGKKLFNTFQPKAGIACATCHRADSEERLVGPGLMNVSIRAETRVPGLTAAEYLHQSIVNPQTYVVPDYPDIMTRTFKVVFTEQEIQDIIAYLFTLRDGARVAQMQ